MIEVAIYINDERIDLYPDEQIMLALSVKNFSDISKVFTDFTQGFTVPASAQNNFVFNHWYNADITSGSFNPAVKKTARIELNGIPFRDGVVSMDKATVKNGRVSDYTITFYGFLASMADLFGEDVLTDLNLDSETIDYSNYVDYIDGTIVDNKTIPLIVARRMTAGASATNGTDLWHDPLVESSFKPAIKIKTILDAIETDYSLTFNSTFFDTADFAKIYMLAHGNAGAPANFRSNWQRLNRTNLVDPSSGTDYDSGNDEFIITSGAGNVTFTISLAGLGTGDYSYDVLVYKNTGGAEVLGVIKNVTQATVRATVARTGSDFQIFFAIRGYTSDQYTWTISASNGVVIDSGANKDNFGIAKFPFTDITYTDSLSSEVVSVSGNLPRQKVSEFLGGLIKMFNLVIIPTAVNTFTIEPFNTWIASGSTVNLNAFVSSYDYEIMPAQFYGEVHFKYADTNYIGGKAFAEKQDNLIQYGDLRTEIVDGNGELLSTETFNIELPFTNLFFKRLRHQVNGNLTNLLVAELVDQDSKFLIEKPILFYRVGTQSISANLFRTKEFEGLTSGFNNFADYNLCYQFNTSNDSYTGSINWGTEINPFTGNDGTGTSPSLYYTYWSDYITDLYDLGARRYTFRGVLPLSFVYSLQLNSKLQIGLNLYRINSAQINLRTGEATLDLLNIID